MVHLDEVGSRREVLEAVSDRGSWFANEGQVPAGVTRDEIAGRTMTGGVVKRGVAQSSIVRLRSGRGRKYTLRESKSSM
jgi:hypothetical protein